MPRKAGTILSTGLLLVLFLIQGILFVRANSQTYDEATHLAAGYSYLATGDFRLDSEHPPLIKELQALILFLIHRIPFNPDPQQWRDGDGYLIGRDFLYKSALPADRILALSRFPNLFLGGVLIVLTGWWAYRLWGNRAAMLAMALASLEPNLVAHSSLVTTDIGVTLFIFLAVYLLWEYLNSSRWWLLVATGVSTGMALLSKFSAVLVIPMIALIIALPLLIGRDPYILLPPKVTQNQPRQMFIQATVVFFLILFFASLIIPAAYFFQGFWLSSFSGFLTLAQAGRPAFFLGEYSYQGWWNYFIISFLIKTPIGSLILIVASLVFYRIGSALGRREMIFLLLPAALIFIAMTQAKINIGLRHVLPVYPFLFVLAARLATVHLQYRWCAPFTIAALLIVTAVSSLRIAPHQLAYFNEFVGGPEQGYRYLSDSNLDWGQDLKGLKAYMEKEKLPIIYLSYFGTAPPSYYGIRYQHVHPVRLSQTRSDPSSYDGNRHQYQPGIWPLEWPPPPDRVPATMPRKILAISVYNLQDVSSPHDPLFRWLWVRRPIAKIGYSIFIYDLTNDPEGLMKLEESNVEAGIKGFP
jgi:4-amino-4-deoxy-L-arabinose transferase-like glycosyltransferase